MLTVCLDLSHLISLVPPSWCLRNENGIDKKLYLSAQNRKNSEWKDGNRNPGISPIQSTRDGDKLKN